MPTTGLDGGIARVPESALSDIESSRSRRTGETLVGKLDPQESSGRTLVPLWVCMGIIFGGLWVFAGEGIHPNRVLGIPIVLVGIVLYIAIAIRT
jgi:hypothetical protein